jgi:hypothetical protein
MTWEDFEEYKIGEEKYDVTKMKDDIKLEELYSLLSAENSFNLIVQENDEEDRSNTGETSADS